MRPAIIALVAKVSMRDVAVLLYCTAQRKQVHSAAITHDAQTAIVASLPHCDVDSYFILRVTLVT